MKKHKVFQLFLLIFYQISTKIVSSNERIFEFTAPLYNLSVEENSVGSKYARSENSTKIGVPLPEKDANCKFRVAEIAGEKSSLFKAHARQVGDFVFLRIRYKGDNPLNRELKDFYDILVKATCKRRDLSNLETTARIHLRVIDRNDASPVFLIDDVGYEAEIGDDTDPFSKVLQVEASDADIGINSAIYYSLVNKSHDFIVEPVSGWIRTLKHVKPGKYSMKVKAEDRASRLYYFDENEVQPSWTADVTITVRETQPKIPKISVEKRKIHEKSSKNRQLAAIITIKDAPTEISIGLNGNEKEHLFEIEPDENSVKDGKRMLYSKKGSTIPKNTNVSLTIGSNYHRKSGFSISKKPQIPQNSTLQIQIEHFSEHNLKFESSDILRIKTDESAPIGRILARFSPILENSDDFQILKFSISNSTKLPFSIGSKNGILRVSKKINRSEGNFEFKVVAELDGLSISAEKSVLVEILDSNDHSPVFAAKWMRQSPIPILKNSKSLIKIDATDPDEGENGKLIFKIHSELPVEIHPISGEIKLMEMPKNGNSWPATVFAVDSGLPMSRMAAMNLIFYRNGTKIPAKPKPIIVPEPENLHSPEFSSFPEVVEVTEDAPIGTVVAKLQAIDEDVGFNGLIRYVIDDVTDVPYEILTIDETSGQITVASDLTKLMKEKQTSREIELKISAIDSGNPPKSTRKNLKLRIKDVNNHPPKFDESAYYLRLSESEKPGKEIFKISANDFDGSENGRIEYSLAATTDSQQNLISIDSKTGKIKLLKRLDREDQEVHKFTVIAQDSGVPRKMGIANFSILLEDVNDNAPKCVRQNSKVRIPEDVPNGAFVTCVGASDADLGMNQKLKFSINNSILNSEKPPFRIDHHSGCIFVNSENPLDFHKYPKFDLSIEVADHGDPMLSTTCHVTIQLIDVPHNHLAIEFDDVAKEASVYENSEVGTEVIMIEAKEVGGGEETMRNRKSPLEYRIIGGDGWPFFQIDSKGTVRTTHKLDRETKSAYWITVEARDVNTDLQKDARRRAVLHVFIRILDRNDHRPIPKKPMYVASVAENSPANVVIVKVEATDADDVDNDAAAPLTFKIVRGDPQSFFRIDLTSGYITTSGQRRLDREKQSEHELWVSICDGGEPQLCSNVVVIVNVTDENDNAPTFTQAIHHYNVRAKFVGKLCRMFAVDIDEGENARLTYNITEGDPRFSIDENGNILTSEAIHGDESYALTVQATDHGTPSQQFAATRVVLTAISRPKKQKNAAPVIAGKKSDYVIPISDADQVGLTVGKLEASDSDGDDLWWNIASGDPDSVFDVRQDTGQLLLAKKVELLKRGELRLNISVTDGEDTDFTTVIIQVSRQISQRPKFSASHYQTDISEKVAVGTQIYTLKATGESLGTKPLIFNLFSIDDISMEDKIRVEPSSGNVIVMEPLDFESSRRIRGIVQVQQANLKSFATIVVNIQDENDNSPYFVQKDLHVFVDESSAPSDLLTTVTAFDKDNDVIRYSIISGNEENLFRINSQTGEISINRKIPKDHVESILRIRSSDGFLRDEMNLHIKNSKLESENLKFDREVYQTSIFDSTPPGTPILQVDRSGATGFTLEPNCTFFEIHELSGVVHLATWITQVQNSGKNLECRVFSDEESTKISVKVIRTNQHSPVFRQEVYRGTIRENRPPGTPILSENHIPLILSATDEDSGAGGVVGYRVLTENDRKLVEIDEFSGVIRSKVAFDYEKTKEFEFYVQAIDMGQPPRRSLLPSLVIISIVDENDESPKFLSDKKEVEILLPTAIGVRIDGQTATDFDSVGNLRYFIKDPKCPVGIDAKSGEIFVKDLNGIEQKFETEIFVTDGKQSTSYILKATPRRLENSNFKFHKSEYTVNLRENTSMPTGTVILAVSTVGTSHAQFLIVNPHEAFFIHPGTGMISSTGILLDREKEKEIRLIVEARNQDETIARTVIRVTVENVNDESPIFLGVPYEVTIGPVDIGKIVLEPKAVDEDEGDAVIITTERMPDFFKLVGGKITVAKKLDGQDQEFNFEVVASDGLHITKEPVKIKVVDKARPVFTQSTYMAVVPKEANRNSTLIKIQAKSSISKGLIGYRILQKVPFNLDFSTGELKFSKFATVEDLKNEYAFDVEAREVTRPKMSSTAQVKIVLKSSNKSPIFENATYSVKTPESTSPGQHIVKIKATSLNDSVSYSMKDTENFKIDEESGDVTVVKALDFEEKQRYEINIVATNSKQVSSESTLIIDIEDVNDEKPQFIRETVNAQVSDSAIPGQFITVMSATDMDTVSSIPDGKLLLFKIIEGDETLFNISPNTGEVTLARIIESEDVEAEGTKMLNISVTDGIFTAYAKLLVEILRSGMRQPPPKFEQSHYVATALENTPVNKSALLTVSVKGGIPPLKYSLGPSGNSSLTSSSKSSWPVGIDSKSGRIHVSRVLNFHNDKKYQIPLVVEDSNRRRAFSTLTLSVMDINDKPPSFVLPFYSTSISESAKEGDTVLMVSATDDDENDMIEYSLLDGSESQFFSVHPRQGTITVAKKLEHKAGVTISLNIKATDSANPPHHATTQVEINIASENVKVPRFSNSHYLFSVLEDIEVGNVIGRVQQMETEIDEVRFSIVPGQELPFSIERGTGKIIVKSSLDREKRDQWKFTIRADAAGGVHSITTITVDVEDVNDNSPSFHGDYTQLTISEDAAVGTSVTIFSAMDKDESPSGRIKFSLINETEDFKLDENSGWLTVNGKLDRETTDSYSLTARATDEGGFNTDLPFTISISDVNDSPPRFEKEEFTIEVGNDPILLNLKIQDADLHPHNISQLFIAEGNEEGIFFIESGQLKIRRREILKDRHKLKIVAFDGVFQASTKVNVVQKADDVNCPPTENIVEIPENSKKGTLILSEPSFSSVPTNVTFKIEDSDSGNAFVVNFRNGIVKIRDPEAFDFEKHQVLRFQRVTLRNSIAICRESITVRIQNVNDNPPRIVQPSIKASIEENLPTSEDQRQFIARIEAEDVDNLDDLKYRLIDDFNGIFRIDERNGVVTTVKTLDSESRDSYTLTAVVSDGKFEEKATIIVNVIDQNDNAPTFEKSGYSMKVMESESVGYELARLRASGGDSNETIEYFLKPSDSAKFVVLDSKSGVLKLAEQLDFEKMKDLKITVIARDSGTPPLETEVLVDIAVMDENDNSPKFEKDKYSAKIGENSKIGEKVTKVRAIDSDSEHFGTVSYQITSLEKNSEKTEKIPFEISQDGEISVSGSIDFEKIKVYNLKIIARDGGRPPLQSEALLEIHVEDENDNPPIFEDCNMTAMILEGENSGFRLMKFAISDLDGPKNSGPFKVEIQGDGAKAFRVTDNLDLVTTKKLEHRKKDKYLLTVIAKDSKGKSTDCPLTVYVRQASRHAPTMKPMRIQVNTLQNELPEGVIGRLKASDEDVEDLLRFGIVDGSIQGPRVPHGFRVDPNTGEIWSDHSILQGNHFFNVTVTDGKFMTVSYVEVQVSSIDNDVIDHAVSIRIRNMGVEEFLQNFVGKFKRVISHHLNLNEENSIQLISVQAVSSSRSRRSSAPSGPTDIEILMTAQRGHGRGYLKPDHVYTRLKSDFQNINDQSDRLRYQLITEMCTPGVCPRGECREIIELMEDEWTKISTSDFSLVSPHHSRSAQCLCPDGFGGKRCEIEENECSKSPCERFQMCIPSVKNSSFECTCPLGMEGDKCQLPSCKNDGKCLEEAELSVGGDGYFEIQLSNEIETRMELEIELKTTTQNGIVMWSRGKLDFHMLRITNGIPEYHWSSGTGIGVVTSKIAIVDGEWHRISISRRQRRTRMTVDDEDLQEAFSPVGSAVVNLRRYSQKLVLGAKVIDGDVTDGVSACFRTIAVDGIKVLKTRQGMKLFGAQPGCSALTSSPCNDLPCNHGGTCIPQGKSNFVCECPSRYSGSTCEIDLEPCSSSPCPNGIQCIPFYNDYLCKCPNGFTGKHCETRGFLDDSASSSSCSVHNPCGATGKCIPIPRHTPQSSDFICNCTGGILQSSPCSEKSQILSDILEFLLKAEIIIVLLGVLFLLLICILAFISYKCCRKSRDPKYGAHCDVPHMRNTRVLVPVAPPPPLPPRGFRNETASTVTRPMVQVKPYSSDIRESRSPSQCGSAKGGSSRPSDKFRRADEMNRIRSSDRRDPRGDVTASLRDSEDIDWHKGIDQRIENVLKYSRAASGAVVVGETELMPVVNDDDYMTMKPRKDKNFERDEPPAIPAHATPLESVLRSSSESYSDRDSHHHKLYDDPNSLDSQSFDDIDEEVNIHIN